MKRLPGPALRKRAAVTWLDGESERPTSLLPPPPNEWTAKPEPPMRGPLKERTPTPLPPPMRGARDGTAAAEAAATTANPRTASPATDLHTAAAATERAGVGFDCEQRKRDERARRQTNGGPERRREAAAHWRYWSQIFGVWHYRFRH